MTNHDVTAEAAILLAAGWTEERITRLDSRQNIQLFRGEWTAYNQTALSAIESAVESVQRAAEPTKPRPGDPMATPKQIDYIVKLLIQRRRSGEEHAGFMATSAYWADNGTRVDTDALGKLTRRDASALIDSLKENY